MVEKNEISVAVVDDKLSSRTKIKERLEALQPSLENVKFIIKTYESGVLFLASKNHYHLILLDYHMPIKNGIQVAAELELRDIQIRPRVLFISGYDDIIRPLQKATQLRVTAGFIFKSDSDKEFQFQVTNVLKAILNVHWLEFEYYLVDNDPALERKREKRNYYSKKIDARKISHIASTSKNVVTIFTDDEEFTTSESLKEFFDKLPKGEFEYSDRRIVINFGFVHSIGKKCVYLTTDDEVSLTAIHGDTFRKSYENYLLQEFGGW